MARLVSGNVTPFTSIWWFINPKTTTWDVFENPHKSCGYLLHFKLVIPHMFFIPSTVCGCFQKWRYPQITLFIRVFHYKPSILGYPYCWKHPCCINPHLSPYQLTSDAAKVAFWPWTKCESGIEPFEGAPGPCSILNRLGIHVCWSNCIWDLSYSECICICMYIYMIDMLIATPHHSEPQLSRVVLVHINFLTKVIRSTRLG